MPVKFHIELFDNKLSAKNHELFLINSSDVPYFKSVNNHIFLYTINDVLKVNQHLYKFAHLNQRYSTLPILCLDKLFCEKSLN